VLTISHWSSFISVICLRRNIPLTNGEYCRVLQWNAEKEEWAEEMRENRNKKRYRGKKERKKERRENAL
jgi:hypothetical protein